MCSSDLVAHQLGGSLGLGILVTVFASATPQELGARELLAHRISSSLSVGAVMLALALVVVVVALIRRPQSVAGAADTAGANAFEEALAEETALT